MARIWPASSTTASLRYMALPVLDPAKVESATLSYQIDEHTADRVDSSDNLLVGIWAADILTCGTTEECIDDYDFIRNQDVVRGWKRKSFDVKPAVTNQKWTSGWQLFFSAKNDVRDSTWFYVDTISIRVCMRP